jgi:hypothetical protein
MGPNRGEVMGGQRKLCNEALHNLNSADIGFTEDDETS